MLRGRKHFCTLVARGQGACSSPTKYGLNGTMPAMVKSTDGSWGIRLAEGTAVCPRSVKKRVKAALSSLASISPAYRRPPGGVGGWARPVVAGCRAARERRCRLPGRQVSAVDDYRGREAAPPMVFRVVRD